MVNFKVFLDIIGRSKVSKAVTRTIKQVQKLRNVANSLNQGYKKTNNQAASLNRLASRVDPSGYQQYSDRLASLREGTSRVTRATGQAKNQMNEFNSFTQKAGDSAISFQGNMLSLMFAGMALKSIFRTMIGPIAKTMGIGKTFSAVLKTVMLPVMQSLMPVIMDIVKWFMGLSKRTKKIIGWMVMFVGILGTLIATVGMVVLAIVGLYNTVPAVLYALVVAALAMFNTLIGATQNWGEKTVQFFKNAWDKTVELFKKAGDWLKSAFFSALNKLKSVANTVMQAVIGHFKTKLEGLVDIFKSTFNLVKNVITGDFEDAKTSVINLLKGITKFVLGGFYDNFTDAIKTVASEFKKLFNNPVDYIKDKIDSLVDNVKGLWENLKKIGDTVTFWNNDNDEGPKVSRINSYNTIPGSNNSMLGRANDFLMQDGKIRRINPRDTVMGFKDGMPGAGTGETTINVNIDSVDSDVDIRKIADEIEDRLDTKYGGRNF